MNYFKAFMVVFLSISIGLAASEQIIDNYAGAENDHFGYDVAYSGSYIIVGVSGDDDAGTNSGGTRIFKLNTSDGSWSLDKTLTPDANDENYGRCVDIDGDWAVVGAYDANKVYVYNKGKNGWFRSGIISRPASSQNDGFGYGVSVSGSYMIIGAPWGSGLDGAVFIYYFDGSAWNLQRKISSPETTPSNFDFGNAVSITPERLIVGASGYYGNSGSVFIYRRDNTDWIQEKILTAEESHFGFSVDISTDYAVVGNPYWDTDRPEFAGRAFVYQRKVTSWSRIRTLETDNPAYHDYFGWDVAITGTTVAIGGIAAEDVYTYQLSDVNCSLLEKLSASDGHTDDDFGRAVAVYNGNVLVGASDHDDGAALKEGRAYVYTDVGAPSVIDENGRVANSFILEQNYPNPFNPTTAISYHLSTSSQVELTIYNELGQKIQTLVNQTQAAGKYSVTFNADGLASGVYFYKLSTGSFTQIRKMILLR